MGTTASKKASTGQHSPSQNPSDPSNASTASQLSDNPNLDPDPHAASKKAPPDAAAAAAAAIDNHHDDPAATDSHSQPHSINHPPSNPDDPQDPNAEGPARQETPGIKQVEVLQVNNPENFEDETNQTGLSHYEMRIQESFFSVPDRPRSRAYEAAAQADRDKRKAKEDRKEKRAARRKSKSKNKGESSEPPAPNTVAWAIENTCKAGILNLSKMDLTEMPPEVFESMPGTARIINIAFNRFTNLDGRICDYVLVQRLIATGNFITEIPPTISHMTDLKKLDLARNKLTSLPDAFGNMRYLEHVDLSENELTALPPSFSSLNLTALVLSNNKFVEAPTEIANMEWLMDLDMSNNSLANIPSAYCGMTQLIALSLDNNRLRDFPDEVFAQCNELVTLRIRGNPLKMATLEAKESYEAFDMRRKAKLKRQIDSGAISEADLIPTDN